MEEFTITEERINDVAVIFLNGFLDAHTSGILEKKFEELLSSGNFKIVVNFKELTYISSAGLGVFMAYIENMRNNGGDIKLCGMSDKIFNIFDMLGFPVLFSITKEQNEAVSQF